MVAPVNLITPDKSFPIVLPCNFSWSTSVYTLSGWGFIRWFVQLIIVLKEVKVTMIWNSANVSPPSSAGSDVIDSISLDSNCAPLYKQWVRVFEIFVKILINHKINRFQLVNGISTVIVFPLLRQSSFSVSG